MISATTIGKNQYAQVSYEISNAASIENFQMPQFKDWLVVSGPSNSSVQSNINGQVSQQTTISFYLQPKHTGLLTVEGAKVILNGKPVTSAGKTVQVLNKQVNDAQASGGAGKTDPFGNLLNDPFFAQHPALEMAPQEDDFSDAMVLQPGENAPEKIKNNLFIKVIPSKTICYEGEPIMATYKVYTRLNMDASVTRRPSFSGFSAYDMEEPNQPYQVETVNGKRYKSWIIRKVQLYPLQSGNLTLEPVDVDCDIRFIKGENIADGGYDPYASGSSTKVQYTLTSPAVSITAQPLPTDNRPQNFAGAVGNFNISAAVNDAAPGKDDAVTLSIHITGNGNFSMVHAPALQWPAKTEAYDPKENEVLDKSVMPIAGDKSFNYVFLPHQAGPFIISAVSFSYFDVNANAYKTISTKPVSLQVAAESRHSNPLTNEQSQNRTSLFSQIATYALPILALGLLLFVVVSFMRRKKKKHISHQNKARAMRAAWEKLEREVEQKRNGSSTVMSTPPANEPQPADHHEAYLPAEPVHQPVSAEPVENIPAAEPSDLPMLQAEMLIWNDDHGLFYKALKTDILQALATTAGTNTTGKIALLQTLKVKGTDVEILQQISSLADECDAALYSPISNSANRHKTLEEAKFLLGKLKAGK